MAFPIGGLKLLSYAERVARAAEPKDILDKLRAWLALGWALGACIYFMIRHADLIRAAMKLLSR